MSAGRAHRQPPGEFASAAVIGALMSGSGRGSWLDARVVAFLWHRDVAAPGGWRRAALESPAALADGAVLRAAVSPDGPCWVVLAARGTRVNGGAPAAGIAVLRDRDELRVGADRLFFSTETLATVAAEPAGERPVVCARCRLAIEAGSPSVRCPGCDVAHHQSERLPCWSYAERCAACDRSTLDAGPRWSPEGL